MRGDKKVERRERRQLGERKIEDRMRKEGKRADRKNNDATRRQRVGARFRSVGVDYKEWARGCK